MLITLDNSKLIFFSWLEHILFTCYSFPHNNTADAKRKRFMVCHIVLMTGRNGLDVKYCRILFGSAVQVVQRE